MTLNEYEQIREKCWATFWEDHLEGCFPEDQPNTLEVFLHAFDRAYALGKQDATITTINGDVTINFD